LAIHSQISLRQRVVIGHGKPPPCIFLAQVFLAKTGGLNDGPYKPTFAITFASGRSFFAAQTLRLAQS
jgi:hypothetical protein